MKMIWHQCPCKHFDKRTALGPSFRTHEHSHVANIELPKFVPVLIIQIIQKSCKSSAIRIVARDRQAAGTALHNMHIRIHAKRLNPHMKMLHKSDLYYKSDLWIFFMLRCRGFRSGSGILRQDP